MGAVNDCGSVRCDGGCEGGVVVCGEWRGLVVSLIS
jgi:hypothetical protein